MVKIRLRRMGAKKRPFYRIVVADSRAARGGRFIEAIGTYDPNPDPPAIKLSNERVEYWLSNGAQPTDTARALLKSAGFLGGPKPKAEVPEGEAPKKRKSTKAARKAAPAAAMTAAEPAVEPDATASTAGPEPAAEATGEAAEPAAEVEAAAESTAEEVAAEAAEPAPEVTVEADEATDEPAEAEKPAETE